MTVTERAAYLKGLADGMKLDENKDEVKLIRELIGIVTDLANDLTDVSDSVHELGDYVEEIDDDLSEVEDAVVEDEDDGCDCGCEDDEDCEYDLECPKCGETILFGEEDDPADIV